MTKAVISVVALVAAGPTLLVLVPTQPPRVPLAHLDAIPLGLAAGAALFVVLAHARPRILLTPLSLATAVMVAAAGMSEEAIWRGFALARVAPVGGVVAAVVVTSAAFAATHVPMLRLRGAAVQLLTGGAFGGLFAVTGSLVTCALAHAAYNLLAVLGRGSPATAAIAFRQAEKRFGDAVALHALDLEIERGEVVALLGPNGAGKTTLVSLCVGLRRPTSGSVRIFGRDPRAWRSRRRLGTTPQQMEFPPTIRGREILDLARAHAADPPSIESLSERFDLAGTLDRQNGSLSGGQRRRLALALAFASAPDLVILDEPTTGLDVAARRAAWDAIRAFHGTVLLTTHHLEEAHSLARRIIVLARGEVVADGELESEDELLRLTQ